MYNNREELLKELEDAKVDRDDALASAENSNKRIEQLHAELEEYKQRDCMKAAFDKGANQIKMFFDSFVDAGFTDEQAFGIITAILPAMFNTAQAPSVDRLLRALL